MSLCVYRNDYLEIFQRRYVSISSPAKHVTRKKITSEQGAVRLTVGERRACARMVAHDTNTCILILCREFEHVLIHILCRDTRVEEALCCPILYSEVHYAALLVWRRSGRRAAAFRIVCMTKHLVA